MRHNHDDDNILHFHDHNHEDEWDCDHSCECDGDCENCDHPPVCETPLSPLDVLIHQIASLRLDILCRNAYDMKLMSKEDYIDMLGYSLSEYHVGGEE